MIHLMPNRLQWAMAKEKPKPKPTLGRPRIAPEKKLRQRSVRMLDAQWARVDANGQQWLRDLVDNAPDPVPTAKANPGA